MKDMIAKKKKFCYEYLKDFNVRKAATRAGYSESSDETTYKIFQDPTVRQLIKSLKVEKVGKMQLTVEAVLNEIKSIAYAIADGEFIKTADKLKALELLGKNLGIFSNKDIAPDNLRINLKIIIVDNIGE